MDRRRFLKYVGAGAVATGGAAGAYYLRNTPLDREPEVTVPTITQTATTTIDYPPYPDFKYKPYHLNPTDQQTIQYPNQNHEDASDSLIFAIPMSWFLCTHWDNLRHGSPARASFPWRLRDSPLP